MPTEKNLKAMVRSKLRNENLSIDSPWESIKDCLNRCALPKPLIKIAVQMKQDRILEKEGIYFNSGKVLVASFIGNVRGKFLKDLAKHNELNHDSSLKVYDMLSKIHTEHMRRVWKK